MFKNRKLLIATKHHKERVIAPLFEKSLAVSCFISEEFDTDSLGTFSGEILRSSDALVTLRKKCILSMEKNHCDLVIASEGSFGEHPTVFFAKANDELMMLMDTKNKLEIIVREVSMKTNLNATLITSEAELESFAQQVGFPSHGLIVKPNEINYTKIFKGITELKELKRHFHNIKNEYGSVYVETDMRANFNPTRMEVIEKAAVKLLNAVKSLCLKCKAPGFIVTKVLSGLPCSWCNCPTNSTLSYLYSCKKCEFTNELLYPHEKTKEDPAYCNFCNP